MFFRWFCTISLPFPQHFPSIFPPQRLSVEIGAYVGYSAMNLARTVRPHGGRVASLEVDPLHVTLVRNMVEYAGLSEVVDVWTGHWVDVGSDFFKSSWQK